jgi:hypothetical protein
MIAPIFSEITNEYRIKFLLIPIHLLLFSLQEQLAHFSLIRAEDEGLQKINRIIVRYLIINNHK